MRVILAAGTQRSGSTWVFNVARLILRTQDPNLKTAWIDDYVPGTETSALLKIHIPDDQWSERAETVLTCHRDLRDVIVSLHDRGWVNKDDKGAALAAAKTTRECHEYWSARSDIDLSYVEIINHPQTSAQRIARACGISIDPNTAAQIVHEVDGLIDGVASYNTENQLHPNHRRDGRIGRWIGNLNADTAEAIVSDNRDWFVRFGYLT
ncbi:sulfotransferase domain-containing protein [Bradyrhizobium hipponense]|uniref:Sulfotransferase domain-containing protein n=1 Tax=Bradyrhizobium hipponense TaxID=2605638 RepID=A0A5S4YBK4_9BRAD|nr:MULTISPECIES: sulfotransferase domain-containing protein [Bradyrhizobium]MDE5446539.1 hypothetical protein [Bradyrhizobium sp. CSA207]TYO61074.1 sulfotransferase domain-containing protein [Bradyrhizobium hipponense]